MRLSDTSTWIDHLNGVITPATGLLAEWVEDRVVTLGDLMVTEILQGIRQEERADRIARGLAQLECVTISGRAIGIAAAGNYRTLRRLGITIRSTIDCLIATYCIVNDVELLHSDRDFDPFEEHLGLKVVRPPGRP